jgi:hypothetical protein
MRLSIMIAAEWPGQRESVRNGEIVRRSAFETVRNQGRQLFAHVSVARSTFFRAENVRLSIDASSLLTTREFSDSMFAWKPASPRGATTQNFTRSVARIGGSKQADRQSGGKTFPDPENNFQIV